MSFSGLIADARNQISMIELSDTHGSGNTSKIRDGHSTPGGAANATAPAGEVQQVGRLRKGIKTPRTRTDSLTRKYAASGSTSSGK